MNWIVTSLTLFTLSIAAQVAFADAAPISQQERDRRAILAMAGNYRVQFNFEETVPLVAGYKLGEPYHETAEEAVIVIVNQPDHVILQHILEAEGMIVKHWRQEWRYENRTLLEYQGNEQWRPRTISAEEAAGTWTQNVYSTDDSPRYCGYGKWVHQANLSYWESNMTARPLPRREYTIRHDYQILMARNRHEITPTGWVQHEDNYKLVLGEHGAKQVLARENGLNIYTKLGNDAMPNVHQWWARHQPFWTDAVAAWDKLYASGQPITIRKDIDGQSLGRTLGKLDKDVIGDKPYDSADARKQIQQVIDRYVVLGAGS